MIILPLLLPHLDACRPPTALSPPSDAASPSASSDATPNSLPHPTPARELRRLFVDVSRTAGIEATHAATWLEHSQTQPFTEGYMAIGQAWGDYDNDGWVDLYVTGNQDANVLYHNERNGTFSISPLSSSVALTHVFSGGALWADYDNDGWRDLYVLSHGTNVLFRNEGGQRLREVTEIAGVGDRGKGTSAAWGDYDADGYLDLYVVNWSCYPECQLIDHERARDRLYHNRSDGTFEDVTHLLAAEQLRGAGFAATFGDFDNDGDPDIYVANDKLQNPIGNVLWRNEGPGCQGWCWTDASALTDADVVMNAMGIAVGDYDNDLDLDLYLSNMVQPMVLLNNDATGTFVDQAVAARVGVGTDQTVGWGTAFFDFNNDGWLDLFLGTTEFQLYLGTMHLGAPNHLYQNLGDGTFRNVAPESGLTTAEPTMGFAYADYDNDGWLDFVVGNWSQGYRLYHNEAADSQSSAIDTHWLSVKLVGSGRVNRDAIGARVYLRTDDNRMLMREVKSGSSLGAGNDIRLHFGLGAARIRELMVRWPDGKVEKREGVPVNTFLRIFHAG